MVVFLDCSKCYRRIGHRTAGERARTSCMPALVFKLVMDAYGGSCLVRVRGGVAHPVKRGDHSLTAGCSFAKDVL